MNKLCRIDPVLKIKQKKKKRKKRKLNILYRTVKCFSDTSDA